MAAAHVEDVEKAGVIALRQISGLHEEARKYRDLGTGRPSEDECLRMVTAKFSAEDAS